MWVGVANRKTARIGILYTISHPSCLNPTRLHKRKGKPVPKVSVIMPCYNVEKYVGASIESVLNSTLVDLELICIDDKSTDSTLNILKKYAQQDSRITVRALKQNSGVSVARNIGIQMATGEYIAFIDSDDTVDKDFYEKLYIAATENKADIARGELKSIDLHGRTNYILLNRTISKNKYNFNYCFTTAIYRLDMIKKHKLEFPVSVSMSEDIYFLISAVSKANCIAMIDNTFYNYIRRDNSLDSSFFSSRKIESAILGIHKLVELIMGLQGLSKEDKSILTKRVADGIKYLWDKDVSIEDFKKIATSMVWLYNAIENKDALISCWGKCICKYIERADILGCVKYRFTKSTRILLCGIIPLAKITSYINQEYKFYLLGILPVFKIRRTYKTEYFICGLLILKIK